MGAPQGYEPLATEEVVLSTLQDPSSSSPPPYGESVTAQPSPTFPPTATLPLATNFTSIAYFNQEIKGTFVIDTSIRVPSVVRDVQRLIPAIENGNLVTKEQRPNARFATSNADVDLVIHLLGEGPVVIEVELDDSQSSEKDHRLRVRIASRSPTTTLNLKVSSNSCSTLITLPLDFVGPVKGGAVNGNVAFSPVLQTQTRTFSIDRQNPSEGRYFIGQASDGTEDRDWAGDVLSVVLEGDKDKERDIRIQTNTEEYWENENESGKGSHGRCNPPSDAQMGVMMMFMMMAGGWACGHFCCR